MKKLLNTLIIGLGLIAGLSFAAGPAKADDAPLRIIYVTHSDTGNAFWLTVKKGMDDACAF
jgi:ABC-type sugar transport system substrate-binding protein